MDMCGRHQKAVGISVSIAEPQLGVLDGRAHHVIDLGVVVGKYTESCDPEHSGPAVNPTCRCQNLDITIVHRRAKPQTKVTSCWGCTTMAIAAGAPCSVKPVGQCFKKIPGTGQMCEMTSSCR